VRFAVVVVALGLVAALPCAAAPVPAPAAEPGRLAAADSLGYIVIPDLQTLMAHAEASGNAVAPSAMPPGAAGTGLAQKLGLPGLEGLAAKPILLVLLKGAGPMGPPRPIVFLPLKDAAKDAKSFESLLTGLNWKSRTAKGLLIASSTPEGLAAAAPLEAEYKRMTATPVGHDLRLFLEMGRVMEAYGPMMQMGMDMALQPKPSTDPAKKDSTPSPALAKLLKAEVKAMLSFFGQVDHLQWDFDLQGEGLLSDTVLAARKGTPFDDVSRMPPPGQNRAAALLTGSGLMTAAYQFDAARVSAFLRTLLAPAAADAPELLTPDVMALIDTLGTAYGSQAAYRMASAPAGRLTVESVGEVKDEAKAMAVLEKAVGLVMPNGPWAPLMEDSKLVIGLQKNARRHAGVAVHRMTVKPKIGGKPLTPAEKAAQTPFLHDTEFAITHGYYLSAQDAAGLDALIDRAVAGPSGPGLSLRAAQEFGEGRHGYVDYDVIGLMKAVSSMTPMPKGQPNPFASLPATGDPLLVAFTFSDGKVRWQSRFPLKSFSQMSEATKKAAPSPAPPAPSAPPKRKP